MSETLQVNGLHVVHAPVPKAPAGRPPLLLVHGLGHGAWCWELWQGRLPALGWESYALSLRGHPDSFNVERETFLKRTRIADYADDVATVAAHIGRPSVLVGHSMGGITAQVYAARHLAAGGALPALVLIAPAGPGHFGPLRPGPVPTDVPYGMPRDVVAKRYFHTATGEVLERALDRICPESPSVVNEFGLAPGIQVPRDALTCPLLVVTGEYDATPVPREGELARYYGGESLHDAENGHDLMLEAGWEPLLLRILRWVEAKTGGRAARG
jgi:pimeloyl-ACP methyl ester carboxylesterase